MTNTTRNRWNTSAYEVIAKDPKVIPFPGPRKHNVAGTRQLVPYMRVPYMVSDHLESHAQVNSIEFKIKFPVQHHMMSVEVTLSPERDPDMPPLFMYDSIQIEPERPGAFHRFCDLLQAIHTQILLGDETENPHWFFAHRSGLVGAYSAATHKEPLSRIDYPNLPDSGF